MVASLKSYLLAARRPIYILHMEPFGSHSTCVYIYVSIIYTCAYLHQYTHLGLYMYIYMHAVHVQVYTCIYMYVYTHSPVAIWHIRLNIRIYIDTYICFLCIHKLPAEACANFVLCVDFQVCLKLFLGLIQSLVRRESLDASHIHGMWA